MAESNSLFSVTDFNIHFNPDGFYNGKNSWLSDDGTVKVIWDPVGNYWVLSGDSLGSTVVFNNNPEYPPINGNWKVLGVNYGVRENQGSCEEIDLFKFTTNTTNPGCKCDGTITISATGGVGPYEYSKTNGWIWTNSPLITDLCGGEHIIKVRDAELRELTQMITMPFSTPAIEYKVSLLEGVTTNLTPKTTKTIYTLDVQPPLPIGVTLTFDIIFAGRAWSTPYQTSVVTTYIPQVIKNTNTLTYQNNTTLTNAPYGGSACAGTIYYTNYSLKYQSFTMDKDDIISIELFMGVDRVCGSSSGSLYELPNEELGPLSYIGWGVTPAYVTCCNGGFDQNGYSLQEPAIAGCNCCTVKLGYDYSWTRA